LVLLPDQELTAAEFTNFMQDRFVTNKVVFADTIPKSVSGKILDRLLRDS